MGCPLPRRQHERYNLAVKISTFERSCPELSKVLKSTQCVGACGIFEMALPGRTTFFLVLSTSFDVSTNFHGMEVNLHSMEASTQFHGSTLEADSLPWRLPWK